MPFLGPSEMIPFLTCHVNVRFCWPTIWVEGLWRVGLVFRMMLGGSVVLEGSNEVWDGPRAGISWIFRRRIGLYDVRKHSKLESHGRIYN